MGGLNSVLGGDGNGKKVNERMERVRERNRVLEEWMEDLSDGMENWFGWKGR